jgi:hypothetical protein
MKLNPFGSLNYQFIVKHGQKTEVSGFWFLVLGSEFGFRVQGSEFKLGLGVSESRIRNAEPGTRNPELGTRNSDPETRNP